MNFAMDDDVLELVDSIADFFTRRGDAATIAEGAATETVTDRERWRALCEMGLPVLCLPEPDGIGAGLLEATAVAEEIGAVLLPEPAVETVVLARTWAAHAPDSTFLETLCSGARVTTLIGFGTATLGASGSLSGCVRVSASEVVDAVALLVADEHTAGTALVVVDGADWTRRVGHTWIDPTRPTSVVDLTGVEPVEVVRLPAGDAARMRRELVVLTAAELVGGMRRVLTETTEFVAAREQFGRAIGSFQAVKHRLVEMYTRTEQARALVQLAAIEDGDDEDIAMSTVGTVARWVPRAAVSTCEDAIHLHGAMGYSWEVDVHLHLKRALAVTAILAELVG